MTDSASGKASAAWLPVTVVLLIAIIAGAGWLAVQRQRETAEQAAENALTSLADLKAAQLSTWIRERRGDAAVARFSATVQRLVAAPADPAVRVEAAAFLEELRKAYDYRAVSLFGPDTTLLLTTADAAGAALPGCAQEHVRAALAGQDTILTDLHRGRAGEPVHFSVLCPIRPLRGTSTTAAGVAMLLMDPERFLLPLLRSQPVPTRSGETVLIHRDGAEAVCLHASRDPAGAPTRPRVPLTRTDLLDVRAALGESGVLRGPDHHGVPVVAVARPVDGTPWSLIAKLDQAEVDEAVGRELRRTGAVLALAAAAVLLGSGLLWRQRSLRLLRAELAERRRVEAALQAREEVFSSIVLQAGDAIALIDGATGGFLEFNAAAHEGLGYTREAFAKLTIADIQAEHSLGDIRNNVERIAGDGGMTFETKHRHRDGRIRDGRVSAHALRLQGRHCMSAVWSDITERKQAETALQQSRALLRLVLDTIPQAVFWKDRESRYLGCNRTFARLAGLPGPDAIVGRTDFDLPWTRSESEAYRAADREVIEGGVAKMHIIETQLTADGTPTWVDTSKLPLSDGTGRPFGVLGIYDDITERRQLEAELRERNEELIRFVYTVSHDLKSPLVTIQTFLGYLEKDLAKGDQARVQADFGYIGRAATKMLELLDELLELSRVGRKTNPTEDVLFADLVRAALDAVAGQIAERHVEVRLKEDAVTLHGDRQRLVEVFQNLIDNAVKFMGRQTAPRIEIGVYTSGREPVFYVRDNGSGIDPRHHGKLFGLFEKLHPGTPGTGMGLALIKRIVEVHGGRIWAESAGPDQGATFQFTIQGARRNGKDSTT